MLEGKSMPSNMAANTNHTPLSQAKAKITKFGDKQASKIRVHTKYFSIRCTQATNLEAWAPQLEWLGGRRAPQNFYSGDQLWGLGALVKMLWSPKGPLKFSLEHSLVYRYILSLMKQTVNPVHLL